MRALGLALLPSLLWAGGLQSTASGDRLKPVPAPRFRTAGPTRGLVVAVDPQQPGPQFEGIGAALTEASAFVLAHLPKPRREALLDRAFGPGGANLALARIPIGACDFSVKGRWSYADVPGDAGLAHFSLAPDKAGFPDAADPSYALLPLIRDARARRPDLKLLASPWTAPAWMKDNQDWYGQGRGGAMKPEHQSTYARYLLAYLDAMAAEGLSVWGLTPVNEPLGNGGQWESLDFTAASMPAFIRDHLGPALAQSPHRGVKLIQYDHNRDAQALAFAAKVLGDPATAQYVWGTGLHWYSDTTRTCTDVLDALRDGYPGKALLHTEGCVDAIGTPENAPGGQFKGWRNDAWWWQVEATDWGYTWAPPASKADHPPYAPVHRYTRDILEGLNHGFVAWIDWNLVLDRRGGPNHVANYCAAPVMVDTATGETHWTPLFDVLTHASRAFQPGSRVLPSVPDRPTELRTCVARGPGGTLTLMAFNPTARAIPWTLRLPGRQARFTTPAQGIQTFEMVWPGPGVEAN